MDIRGKIALVTGANRGLGRAFAEALLEAGATKVYAGARDPSAVIDPRVTPIHVDVTSSRDIAAAAATCTDIESLINNAGAMLATPVLAENSEDVLRREMEVNVFGMLAMSRAFAPVLARNGGGVLVNMLSVVSWYVYPFNSTYCATKHAALAVTDGLRIQLKAQGTRHYRDRGLRRPDRHRDGRDAVQRPENLPTAGGRENNPRHSLWHRACRG